MSTSATPLSRVLLGDERDEESLITGVVSGELQRQIEAMRDQGWSRLDPVKRSFVLAYVETGSMPLACEALEIPMSTGRKYLVDPLVRACIKDVQDVLLTDSIITQAEVRRRMERIFDIAIGDVDTKKILGDGSRVTGPDMDLNVARNINEWFGKELGMTSTDKTKRGPVIVNIDFGRLSQGAQSAQNTVTIEQLPDAGEIDD